MAEQVQSTRPLKRRQAVRRHRFTERESDRRQAEMVLEAMRCRNAVDVGLRSQQGDQR